MVSPPARNQATIPTWAPVSKRSVILESPEKGLVAELHQIKRDLLVLRRNVWPMREALNSLIRDSFPVITEDTRVCLPVAT